MVNCKIESREMIEHPDHYTSGDIEAWDAFEASAPTPSHFRFYCATTARKHLWRAPYKGTEEMDYEKALQYIQRALRSYKKEHEGK